MNTNMNLTAHSLAVNIVFQKMFNYSNGILSVKMYGL